MNKGEATTITILAGSLLALGLLLSNLLGQLQTLKDKTPNVALGSVTVGNEYYATTTSAISGMPTVALLTANTAPRQGTFGSFIQTTAGGAGGNINLYDATTTNVFKRTGQKATSTILIASLPTNATVGTYTFDVVYNTGLLVVTDGTVGTTTITWR